jgi:hypothetical protein
MLNSFVSALSSVLTVELFPILTGEESRDFICGTPEIDVDLLRKIVEYEGCSDTDEVIGFFFSGKHFVSSLTRSENCVFSLFGREIGSF